LFIFGIVDFIDGKKKRIEQAAELERLKKESALLKKMADKLSNIKELNKKDVDELAKLHKELTKNGNTRA